MKSRNPSAARRASLPVATVVLAVAAGAGTPAAAASAPRVACMPRTAYVGSEYRTVAAQDTAVTPINTCTNKAGPAIPLGEGWAPPSAIAITPNGATAYLLGVNQVGAGMVTPIRTRTNKAGRAIPVGADPRAIAITPNGATAYVVNASSDTVTPISTRTNKAGPAIPVGPDPGVIAIMTGNRLPVPSRTHKPTLGPRSLRGSEEVAGRGLPEQDGRGQAGQHFQSHAGDDAGICRRPESGRDVRDDDVRNARHEVMAALLAFRPVSPCGRC
jgi:YVTN family beta-propeller protein